MDKIKIFIHKYWGRTDFGRKMLESKFVSDLDLLFLIPNNVKRRNGVPTTRICGKNKRKQKRDKRRIILSFPLFEIISEIIEETLPQQIDESFGTFVEIKDISIGDKNVITIPTEIGKPVKFMFQNENK
jgi:hypothetical protein